MKYFTVKEMSKKWDVPERTVRNYCSNGKISGAYLSGKTWFIPEDAKNPRNIDPAKKPNPLLKRIKEEKSGGIHGGIYHKIQIELTYNSNHIEGSRLTQDQTRLIFETSTIGAEGALKVDDILETANHFKCVDMIIDNANRALNENFIKRLHRTLKNGTSDSRKDWFAIGEYKKLPNEVGGKSTAEPEEVDSEMKKLISEYNRNSKKTLDDLLDFHCKFERIHPFQDGNGRVGRLILFKECLKYQIVPFIIGEDLKMYYYRGLSEWSRERGYLRDTCLTAQDRFKEYLKYFRIEFEK